MTSLHKPQRTQSAQKMKMVQKLLDADVRRFTQIVLCVFKNLLNLLNLLTHFRNRQHELHYIFYVSLRPRRALR